jgi:hypothetical protein
MFNWVNRTAVDVAILEVFIFSDEGLFILGELLRLFLLDFVNAYQNQPYNHEECGNEDNDPYDFNSVRVGDGHWPKTEVQIKLHFVESIYGT